MIKSVQMISMQVADRIKYENDLKVARLTAAKYLDILADDGLLRKEKICRSNYYINTALYSILTKEYEI